MLQHPNYVASVMAMSDTELRTAAALARSVHIEVQGGGNGKLDTLKNPIRAKEARVISPDALMWREHILALMLLRDCIGREMISRGMEPIGPPMLARDWTLEHVYRTVYKINMPEWLAGEETEKT